MKDKQKGNPERVLTSPALVVGSSHEEKDDLEEEREIKYWLESQRFLNLNTVLARCLNKWVLETLSCLHMGSSSGLEYYLNALYKALDIRQTSNNGELLELGRWFRQQAQGAEFDPQNPCVGGGGVYWS